MAYRLPKELPTDLKSEQLPQRAWNRVSELTLNDAPLTHQRVIGREGLQACDFGRREEAIAPVERTRGGSGIRLQSPRWLVLRELQKERPELRTPSENQDDRLQAADAGRGGSL
jgi:hypothetical protein